MLNCVHFTIDAFARIHVHMYISIEVKFVSLDELQRVEVFIVYLFMTSTSHQPHFVFVLVRLRRREFAACAQCQESVVTTPEQGIFGYCMKVC